ncbi:MAG: hypothetical protein VSS75_002025 [Candidatus Parabeggiatoa sp.]|nr:hypothetical protein [Candidatus Parabeggiatoa sp.]
MIEAITTIDKGVATLVAAIIAATASIIGLFINYSLSRKQEKLKNKLEIKSNIDKRQSEISTTGQFLF